MKNNLAYENAFPKMLLADTVLTLEQLHSRAILTGIVTSTSRRSLMRDLARYEFPNDLVDYIQTEDDTSHHKPDPRVFEPLLTWLLEHKVEPIQVLYVGDGLHDMRAALGVGFNFVGVTTGIVTPEEFTAAGGKSIKTLSTLQSLIK